jgi:DNA-directed RNA polymerase specialized sigma subunit
MDIHEIHRQRGITMAERLENRRKRDEEIMRYYYEPMLNDPEAEPRGLRATGKHFGISHQRVSQILRRNNPKD